MRALRQIMVMNKANVKKTGEGLIVATEREQFVKSVKPRDVVTEANEV